MILEIYLSKDTKQLGDIGRVYLDTDNIKLIDEIKKYRCPLRMCLFLDNEIQNYQNVREIITDKEIRKSHVDLLIDFSDTSLDIINSHPYAIFDFEKYIDNTSHLDKYGNDLELEECDLTQNSDSGYEMDLDNYLYK